MIYKKLKQASSKQFSLYHPSILMIMINFLAKSRISLRENFSIKTFSPYPGRNYHFGYFRPGYDEKSYSQHGDKEGQSRARSATRRGLITFLPPCMQ